MGAMFLSNSSPGMGVLELFYLVEAHIRRVSLLHNLFTLNFHIMFGS